MKTKKHIYNKEYYYKNLQSILKQKKEYHKNNSVKIIAYQKEYRLKNHDKIKKIRVERYKKNKEYIKQKASEYYYKNKDTAKYNNRRSVWRKNNKHKLSQYWKNKRKTDEIYHIGAVVRSRVNMALKRDKASKSGNTETLLGCSIKQLKQHLEKQFAHGMSWENQGEWHIDHIIPCSSFNLINPEEQKKCFHYTNMQPLWASDNIKKGNKLPCIAV